MNATLSGITGYFSQRPDTSYSFTYRGRTHESYRWKRAENSYLKDDKTNIIFCTQDIHSKKNGRGASGKTCGKGTADPPGKDGIFRKYEP